MSAVQIANGPLFLGDIQDALNFEGERLCVLEQPMNYPGMTWHIPILRPKLNAPQGEFYADAGQLDLARLLINARLNQGVPLLVHCAAGIERSPLTCAWYLVRENAYPTLDEAYAFLKSVRPVVEDRQAWLNGHPCL